MCRRVCVCVCVCVCVFPPLETEQRGDVLEAWLACVHWPGRSRLFVRFCCPSVDLHAHTTASVTPSLPSPLSSRFVPPPRGGIQIAHIHQGKLDDVRSPRGRPGTLFPHPRARYEQRKQQQQHLLQRQRWGQLPKFAGLVHQREPCRREPLREGNRSNSGSSGRGGGGRGSEPGHPKAPATNTRCAGRAEVPPQRHRGKRLVGLAPLCYFILGGVGRSGLSM